MGITVGILVGIVVGLTLGTIEGVIVGAELGTTVGDEVGAKVWGLNTALQIRQVRDPTCSPTDITDTVSAPCTVSSFKHWSSCSNKFTEVTPTSTGRIATNVLAVAVFTVPYIAGGRR